MIITCAAVTILLVYFLLCSENYHWQWRAFNTAGASAGYVFANAMIYWLRNISFGSLTSVVLYFGYSALISFLFFILTGKSLICSDLEYQGYANKALKELLASFQVGCLCIESTGQ